MPGSPKFETLSFSDFRSRSLSLLRARNPRLAKLHRSYDVRELSDRLGVHKNSVRQWIREGLPVVDGARPTLILGNEFQAWWAKREKAKKRPCQPGQMYCFKCREPKAPALGMVEYAATNAVTGNLKAMCETCGTDDAPAHPAGRHRSQNARFGHSDYARTFKHSCAGASFFKL